MANLCQEAVGLESSQSFTPVRGGLSSLVSRGGTPSSLSRVGNMCLGTESSKQFFTLATVRVTSADIQQLRVTLSTPNQ